MSPLVKVKEGVSQYIKLVLLVERVALKEKESYCVLASPIHYISLDLPHVST